ncbi:MAG TPA: hypothetical protein PLR82_05250 [Bacillota bacterium]|nr:hypothetical protein [Bacillota bacterium]
MINVKELVATVKQLVKEEEEHENEKTRKAGLPEVVAGSPADLVLKQNMDSISPAAFVKAFRPVVEAAGVSGEKRVLFACYLLYMASRKLWSERELEHKKKDGTWTRYFGVPCGTRRDKDGNIKEEGWDTIKHHVLGEEDGFDEANAIIKALKKANLVREVFHGAIALAGTEAESRKTKAKSKTRDVPKPSFLD